MTAAAWAIAALAALLIGADAWLRAGDRRAERFANETHEPGKWTP